MYGAGAAGAGQDANGNMVPGPGMMVGTVLLIIWALAVFVPSLALSVRRLHDTNRSGWMLLLGLIPFVGAIILLVFYVLEANPAGQRFDRPAG